MKILIANYEFKNFYGGTQTWSLTMLRALRSLGHEVYLDSYVDEWDKEIALEKVPSFWKPDVIVINGNKTLRKYRFAIALKCFVCHGILPDLEQPRPGADMYFAVSEEVEQHIKALGYRCDGILRNPVGIPSWRDVRPIAKELQTIAIINRRRCYRLADELGKYFEILSLGMPPVRDVWEQAITADLVIGTGRVAYEAMANGKAVLVSGNNSGRGEDEWMDGYMTESLFYSARKNNCSGRFFKKRISTVEQVLTELKNYREASGLENYQLIVRENEASVVANLLLQKVQGHFYRPLPLMARVRRYLRK